MNVSTVCTQLNEHVHFAPVHAGQLAPPKRRPEPLLDFGAWFDQQMAKRQAAKR